MALSPDDRPDLRPDDRPDLQPETDDLPAGRLSRRSFLRTSALGAGAAALPLGAAACDPATDPTADVPPLDDHWVEPSEWNVGTIGDTPLQLVVSEIAAPAWLRVNAGGGGTAKAPKGPNTLFTYNGKIPGPTIRMRGDDVLRVNLINTLSGNNATWAHNSSSRFAKTPTLIGPTGPITKPDGTAYQPNDIVPELPDWELSGNLLYGPHMQHTTNLHTHGLHVRPGLNLDGTQSDNVMLRVIPFEDATNRALHNPPIPLSQGRQGDNQAVEVAGQASYEFQLGAASGPGVPTHPPGTHWYHPHPHGATYDQVVSGMAGFLIIEGDVDDALGQALADPAYEYRERLFLFQRVFDTGTAPIGDDESVSALGNRLNKNEGTVNTVNGEAAGTLAFSMAGGAVERWRFLNGSVDGQGFVRVCVAADNAPPPPTEPANTDKSEEANREYDAALAAWAEDHAVQMWHLAFDGVTLVSEAGAYTARPVGSVELAPANRSDFLFQAPAAAGTYHLWGLGVTERAGDPGQPTLQIATLTVVDRGDTPDALPAGFFDRVLASVPVPAELLPVPDTELAVDGGIRTRQLVYSGWGGSYACPTGSTVIDGGKGTNSMAISRLKYDPNRPVQLMGLGTAEEWVLDNYAVGHDLSPNGAVAHPFHMHQNPFWVLAIYDPVWDGDAVSYVNRLSAPRWQDVVPIPVNGGRVVFRSRFPDFFGFYVNHCHLLQHEDWGMMQAVEVMENPATANFAVHAQPYNVAQPTTAPSYPLPTPALMVEYCQQFHDIDGTIGPGGVVEGGTWISFCDPPAPNPEAV